jgi:transposase-like protein
MTETRELRKESNSDKFRILANKRVPRALKALDLVGNLSNRSNYSYTDEEASKIIKVFKDKVKQLESMFARKTRSQDEWSL